jgi:hypothetical protein
MRDIYITININGRREGKGMVQPIEASGTKSICTLVDVKDWDTAWDRLKELGVPVSYRKGRPVVNVEEVRAASLKWCKRHRGK